MQRKKRLFVRLQVDYGSKALWVANDYGLSDDVDPETLGLSPELAARIDAWIEDYHTNMQSPSREARRSVKRGAAPEGNAFMVEGFRIAADVQEELGENAVVSFFRNLGTPEMPPTRDLSGMDLEWRADPHPE
jgi:hypothetical protein